MNKELNELKEDLENSALRLRKILDRRPNEKKEIRAYYEGVISGLLDALSRLEFINNQKSKS